LSLFGGLKSSAIKIVWRFGASEQMTTIPNAPVAPVQAAQSAQERADAMRAEQARQDAQRDAVYTAETVTIEQSSQKDSLERSGRFNDGAMSFAQGAVVGLVVIGLFGILSGSGE
jgi:hypothetical protein